jgi:arsenite methyltransferase
MLPTVDIDELRGKVKSMYQQVALEPKGEFHFEMGRALAERLGYSNEDLDAIPAEATDSFAGVGYHLDLADLREGERVLDLGSGSGMDSFLAALKVGPRGQVTGLDMTDEQLEKAKALAERLGFEHVSFVKGYMEEMPLDDASFDVVISNGVINLAAEKDKVFEGVVRVLAPGGRLAISDIVTEKQLSDAIVCDSSLWAACIGGAAQENRYRDLIEAVGLQIVTIRENAQYQFLSKSAQGASKKFGVKSVSLLAERARASQRR